MLGSLITPQNLMNMLARVIVLMTALPLHEFAHAYAADKMGDPTAKESGRLTLNPLAHLDLRGSLLILLVGFGFAKPVPVDPRNFKNRKMGEVVTSLAGPLSNVLLAFVMLTLVKAGFYYTEFYAGAEVARALAGPLMVFRIMVYINCSLAVFNLLPVPPLDGWHVLAQALPKKGYNWLVTHQNYIATLFVAAVIFGLLDGVILTLSGYILDGLFWATGFVERLFGL